MNNITHELNANERLVYEDERGFYITEKPDELDDSLSVFTVYGNSDEIIGAFIDNKLNDDELGDNFTSTPVFETFQDFIFDTSDAQYNDYPSDDDWYDDFGPSVFNHYDTKRELTQEEKEAEAKMVDELCKSDTIVFHKDDPSTVMLKPIYEGRGWDVYTGTTWNGLSKESVNELIKRHDKILFMGHGTPSGLIGSNMDAENSHLIKDKKVFALWCYAATFLKSQGLHGIFCSDNCPSEVWECKSACDAQVSAEWIYDNMVYLSECIRDVIDICWDNPEEACRKAREAYSKSKADTPDEKKVVEFNTNTLQVS